MLEVRTLRVPHKCKARPALDRGANQEELMVIEWYLKGFETDLLDTIKTEPSSAEDDGFDSSLKSPNDNDDDHHNSSENEIELDFKVEDEDNTDAFGDLDDGLNKGSVLRKDWLLRCQRLGESAMLGWEVVVSVRLSFLPLAL
ncbi:hypothetical protein LTR37_008970 [Vermiconidia calcicola]|uniref:Uncharacterized protein n=1 Tax=Vermiconidia calcicola TaxID=1690605 RepID=A0ACC3N9H1_9PEZI|nr:hypothetical protein LTR37_008970 [Vermiconidia calcicola]